MVNHQINASTCDDSVEYKSQGLGDMCVLTMVSMRDSVDGVEPRWSDRNPPNNRYRLPISPKYCVFFLLRKNIGQP